MGFFYWMYLRNWTLMVPTTLQRTSSLHKFVLVTGLFQGHHPTTLILPLHLSWCLCIFDLWILGNTSVAMMPFLFFYSACLCYLCFLFSSLNIFEDTFSFLRFQKWQLQVCWISSLWQGAIIFVSLEARNTGWTWYWCYLCMFSACFTRWISEDSQFLFHASY